MNFIRIAVIIAFVWLLPAILICPIAILNGIDLDEDDDEYINSYMIGAPIFNIVVLLSLVINLVGITVIKVSKKITRNGDDKNKNKKYFRNTE